MHQLQEVSNSANFQTENPKSIEMLLYPDYISFPVLRTTVFRKTLSEIGWINWEQGPALWNTIGRNEVRTQGPQASWRTWQGSLLGGMMASEIQGNHRNHMCGKHCQRRDSMSELSPHGVNPRSFDVIVASRPYLLVLGSKNSSVAHQSIRQESLLPFSPLPGVFCFRDPFADGCRIEMTYQF